MDIMDYELFKGLPDSERKKIHDDLNRLVKTTRLTPKEATEALKILKPSLFGIGKNGNVLLIPKYKQFSDLMVKEGDTVSEYIVFDQLKAGRLECKILIRDNINKPYPEDRKWISFEPRKGYYKLEAIGQDMPEGWKGYKVDKRGGDQRKNKYDDDKEVNLL
jgi:hypothetical protein